MCSYPLSTGGHKLGQIFEIGVSYQNITDNLNLCYIWQPNIGIWSLLHWPLNLRCIFQATTQGRHFLPPGGCLSKHVWTICTKCDSKGGDHGHPLIEYHICWLFIVWMLVKQPPSGKNLHYLESVAWKITEAWKCAVSLHKQCLVAKHEKA